MPAVTLGHESGPMLRILASTFRVGPNRRIATKIQAANSEWTLRDCRLTCLAIALSTTSGPSYSTVELCFSSLSDINVDSAFRRSYYALVRPVAKLCSKKQCSTHCRHVYPMAAFSCDWLVVKPKKIHNHLAHPHFNELRLD